MIETIAYKVWNQKLFVRIVSIKLAAFPLNFELVFNKFNDFASFTRLVVINWWRWTWMNIWYNDDIVNDDEWQRHWFQVQTNYSYSAE